MFMPVWCVANTSKEEELQLMHLRTRLLSLIMYSLISQVWDFIAYLTTMKLSVIHRWM